MASSSARIGEPWIHRRFLKDAKLQARERYFREFCPDQPLQATRIFLPDAITWRKYLRLIQKLAAAVDAEKDQWVLLESVSEYMDYRNQSPVLLGQRESAALQERSLLQKMVQDETIKAWADLSYRDADQDEWDVLEYASMSLEERSRNALVRAARMTQQQSVASGLVARLATVYLVVDEKEGRVTLEEGVRYLSMRELVLEFASSNNLSAEQREALESLEAACESDYVRRNTPQNEQDTAATTTIWTVDQIQGGLKAGRLFQGRLNVTRENPKEAFVHVFGAGQASYFVDRERGHFNNSFHHDMVVVEPLPEHEWGRPVGKRRLVFHRDDDGEDTTADDFDLPAVPSARVVQMAKPSRRVFVATMTDVPAGDESAVLVVPMDMRIPKIRLRTRSWHTYVKMRLKVEVDDWEPESNFPQGHVVAILGPIGDLETEISALLIENQVQLDPFSIDALACLPSAGSKWSVPASEIALRRDLRKSRRIFSVDPPGCQDIDDTMHAEVLPNGDIEIGVHIADVTYFVSHKSPLDRQAQIRGTTFYLVDRRFDMLPSLLSGDLCSLHGGIDRLAVSAIWTFSSDFTEIKSSWYGRTVIHNVAAMTYDQADRILQNKPPDNPNTSPPAPLTAGAPVNPKIIGQLKADLTILTSLARKLRTDREDIGGAVDLSSGDLGNELKFKLVSGKPVAVSSKEDKEIHHTIAELMILANSHVAARIYRSYPDSALLRIHRPVEEDRLEDLREVLGASGVAFDGTSNMELGKALKEAERNNKSAGTVNALFRSLATRAMTEAQYVSTGDGDGADFSHFGLGLKEYTHFTSPIRRYADVIVHKQLLSSLVIDQTRIERPLGRTGMRQTPEPAPLPTSETISILAGEGLRERRERRFDTDSVVDEVTDGASRLVLTENPNASPGDSSVSKPLERASTTPYTGSEVSSICEGLNLHNRLAKHSSAECQNLFLSLYFKDNTEVAEAVVTSLRKNGMWVFVPKFDMRGPVYLRDMEGSIQIDPALVGLRPTSGSSPTLGFASAGGSRRFPSGTCQLYEDSDPRLEISVDGFGSHKFVVRPLDVVSVQLSCENWDVRARVPSPRLHLLSRNKQHSRNASVARSRVTSKEVNERAQEREESGSSVLSSDDNVYNVLSSLQLYRNLDVPLRTTGNRVKVTMANRQQGMKGRVIFGEFVNPDTRSAGQEAAQRAAAEETAARRAILQESVSRRGEYDMSRQTERSVTLRQQRLAAGKRNTRRAKAK